MAGRRGTGRAGGADVAERPAPGGAEASYWQVMAAADEREARRKKTVAMTAWATAMVAVGAMVAVAVIVQNRADGRPADDRQRTGAAGVAASAAPGTASAGPAQADGPGAGTATTVSAPGLKLGPAAKVGAAAGRDGQAALLTGSGDSWAEATGAAVDTTRDFTVSAVVRNEAASAPKAALSQNGAQFFAFYLGREDSSAATRNRWVFKVQTAEDAGKTAMALSPGAAATGRWTTLTGVYSAKAKTISLYVDGALAQTTAAPAIIPGQGPLELGRARWKGKWSDAWNGGITDVRVWKEALTADQVGKLPKGGPATAGGVLNP
ncbi:LamG domain-containing protein [Kitasatospora sp. NPDC088391]|uniref:LamG domain-containing protein n=1 Tax=Kitasatospora sp. NPDC088391 TaxID=3364074 RepID=UPI0037F929E6